MSCRYDRHADEQGAAVTTPEDPDAPVSDEPTSEPSAEVPAERTPETTDTDKSRALPEERHSRTTELAARLRQSALAQVEAARAAGTTSENEPAAPPSPVIPALDEPSYRITERPSPPVTPAAPEAEPEAAAQDEPELAAEGDAAPAEDALAPETWAPAESETEDAPDPEPVVVDSPPRSDDDTSYLTGPLEPVEPRRGVWLPLATSAMALLTIAAVVLLVIFTHRASQDSAVAKARVAALAAAKTETAAALTYNYQTLDADFAHAEAGMSKAFRANYAQTAASSVAPLATKTHAVTTGMIVAGGVISATPNSAEVLVFANQTVENKLLNATSRLDRSVIEVSMVKQDGHWLINDLKPF